jgi:hypothetical protein
MFPTSSHSRKKVVGVVGPELTVTAGNGAADADPEIGNATGTNEANTNSVANPVGLRMLAPLILARPRNYA